MYIRFHQIFLRLRWDRLAVLLPEEETQRRRRGYGHHGRRKRHRPRSRPPGKEFYALHALLVGQGHLSVYNLNLDLPLLLSQIPIFGSPA